MTFAENFYVFARFEKSQGEGNDLDSSKSLLFVLTNQVNDMINLTNIKVSKAFNAGDKICDILLDDPTTDCITVAEDGTVPTLEIKAGAPPKIYALSKD
jgi:hypothetical protein